MWRYGLILSSALLAAACGIGTPMPSPAPSDASEICRQAFAGGLPSVPADQVDANQRIIRCVEGSGQTLDSVEATVSTGPTGDLVEELAKPAPPEPGLVACAGYPGAETRWVVDPSQPRVVAVAATACGTIVPAEQAVARAGFRSV